jgi:hypothetical protein
MEEYPCRAGGDCAPFSLPLFKGFQEPLRWDLDPVSVGVGFAIRKVSCRQLRGGFIVRFKDMASRPSALELLVEHPTHLLFRWRQI